MVALGAEGELIFEEDREGSIGAYGIHIKDRSFLNGARHSIYYHRVENSTTLLVTCLLLMSKNRGRLNFSQVD